jgi:hypothetical protein
MERETKEFLTPIDKHKVRIKTYITGGELEQIEEILYKRIKLSSVEKDANINLNDISFITEQTHKTIEIMVVSVNGKSENILEEVLNMKSEDYKFIQEKIEEVTKITPKKKE